MEKRRRGGAPSSSPRRQSGTSPAVWLAFLSVSLLGCDLTGPGESYFGIAVVGRVSGPGDEPESGVIVTGEAFDDELGGRPFIGSWAEHSGADTTDAQGRYEILFGTLFGGCPQAGEPAGTASVRLRFRPSEGSPLQPDSAILEDIELIQCRAVRKTVDVVLSETPGAT